MSKINILLTEANGNLSDSKEMIRAAIETAEKYAFLRLKIDWDIDVLVTNRIPLMIPENGAGGYTFSADFIRINIDDKKVTKNLISENVAHELCHAARWGKNNEWIESLFDGLIFEGLACVFEAEFSMNNAEKSLFIKTITERHEEDNVKILKLVYDRLDSNSYNYDEIFFTGNEKLPRWSGYSLGYYLVKKYLEKTNKKIEDAFSDKYVDFRVVL
ncbi:hypothetical protein IKG10_01295 [Candidatus Saccharibacteria bacterium]|nr:hypothetical protein [Candidatus Saccharibacteria bacterium]